MNRRLLVLALGLGFGLLEVRGAEAQSRVPARLVWEGSVCGSASEFAARVGKRTSAVRFVRRGQRLVVRARIERRGEGLDASASIEARGTAPIVRRLESPDCDDALDALALVVAIGVEGASQTPRARRRAPRREAPEPAVEPPAAPAPDGAGEVPTPVPAPSEPSPEAAPNGAPPSAAPGADTRAVSEPAEPERPSPLPTRPLPDPVPDPEPPARLPPAQRAPELDQDPGVARRELEIGAGLAAALSVGVAPGPLLGGALWISVGWARRELWSPELVLSAQHQRRGGVDRPSGRADFALSAASLLLCPLRFGSEAFALRPCASGSFGRLHGEGHDTFDARASTRPWSALGGTLEALAMIGVIELRAGLGAAAPLSRDSFSFAGACADGSPCPADVFHHVAPVIWSGALGAGVRVW